MLEIKDPLASLFIKDHPFKVGNDLVYLPRFRESVTPLFIKRTFTERECAYAERFTDPPLRHASTFAAKEAVYKAIKQWLPAEAIGFRNIEILRETIQGKPSVVLHHDAFEKLNISLSISHDGDYVWEVAVVFSLPPQ